MDPDPDKCYTRKEQAACAVRTLPDVQRDPGFVCSEPKDGWSNNARLIPKCFGHQSIMNHIKKSGR